MMPKTAFHRKANKFVASLLAAGTVLLAAGTASADILLTIDITDINAVSFTATGNFPSMNSSDTTNVDGITLLKFFTTALSGTEYAFATSSSLIPAGTTHAYDRWYNDDTSGSFVDMNIYDGNTLESETQVFATGNVAFTGSATFNLATFSLHSMGFSGTLVTGYNGATETPIGSWQIVPEPHTVGLLVLGGFGALACRRCVLRESF